MIFLITSLQISSEKRLNIYARVVKFVLTVQRGQKKIYHPAFLKRGKKFQGAPSKDLILFSYEEKILLQIKKNCIRVDI
jgi:hypothetical protein